tara:strand:+ start:51 stop:437 length:387 start_codon:yes stop_codon:yes gene_type:complete
MKYTEKERAEAKAESARKYREANRDVMRSRTNQWYKLQTNKDKRMAYQKKVRNDNKLDYHAIYIIDNYDNQGNHYCGVTENPTTREYWHKSNSKLNVDNTVYVDRADTRKEALLIESEYHSKGYHGGE